MGSFLKKDPIGFAGGVSLYGYVRNNPITVIDSFGLFNLLIGAGGSAVAPTGIEGSTGIVVNPGFGDNLADVGFFGSIGSGGGVNVSGDIYVGYIEGGIKNVSGMTTNVNLTLGPLSITIFIDPKTGKIIGGTGGIGPGATPIGASGTISQTDTKTVRNFIDWLFPKAESCK